MSGLEFLGGSGGGSSFEHLTEDADQSYLFTDWGIWASPDGTFDGAYAGFEAGHVEVRTASPGLAAITVMSAGDVEPRAAITSDGGLRFGDGTNPADVAFARLGPGVFGTDGALAVGNSAAATTPGTVTKKIEIFNAVGASIGFIAVYDAIT